MRSLVLAALLLLSPIALAGGAGPRPGFPLAVGQVWEVQWFLGAGAPATQQLTTGQEFPQSPDGVRSFQVQGGALAAFPPARYFLLTQDGRVKWFCIAQATRPHQGYVLRGTAEELGALVPQKYVNHNPNDAELYEAAKGAGHGTCTLRRIR